MAKKFEGSIEDLKLCIDSVQIKGKWSNDEQGKYVFVSHKGGVLNWWESTGTVQIQGKGSEKVALENAVWGPKNAGPAPLPAKGPR